ncbi:MAG: histidine kinase [Bacteroidota bacterium]|nr:histidine kinase [Bacteroidota bacterium]
MQFCYLLFIAANYYLHRLVSIPKLLYRKRYVLFAAFVLGGIVTSAVLRSLLVIYLNGHVYHLPSSPAFAPVFGDSVLNLSIWVTGLIAVHLLIEKIRFQRYIDAVEREKTKNELDFLKAQFNPHFLFNSINSIYGHIDKGNGRARNMLLTFSDMLRYQLYECNADAIPIEKEINYIRNYVAIQQTRQEEDLVVRLHIGGDVRGFFIAPLLFTSFIENAFKFVGKKESGENFVEICLEKAPGELRFRITNSMERQHVAPSPPSLTRQGIGIANVRRRLELLYPGRHDLRVRAREDSFEVSLDIKIEAAACSPDQ